jgi:uncharacterized protein YdaL
MNSFVQRVLPKKHVAVLILGSLLLSFNYAGFSQIKRVLVIVEGDYGLKNGPTAEGRQLENLLGHFDVNTTIKGVNAYIDNETDRFDYVFYVGYHDNFKIPAVFLKDIANTNKPVFWINAGIAQLCQVQGEKQKLGFDCLASDSLIGFDMVKTSTCQFTKGIPNIHILKVNNKNGVDVLATAYSTKKKQSTPYIVVSGKFHYISDSPFQTATETDRYLLFADYLHDFLGIQHPTNHQAIIRIEDVTPMDNPDRLRDIADILSSRGIPFLVGVVPIYVNPVENIRVKLSDKPEMVDALKYVVRNGGTIVMHGVTHQYRGISTDDYEFWDGSTHKPIKGETAEEISSKLETGIDEFFKNGIYPLLWETPHYTASFNLYKTASHFFSTAIEQRLSIEDADYSQYFPYIINKDVFGQRIIPENLGYVPLYPNVDSSRYYVQKIISNARASLAVRDGFASCFFHSFLNLDLLKELVDGLKNDGFTFFDARKLNNWVKTNSKVIISGSQSYALNLNNDYLYEAYYNSEGNLVKKSFSPNRIIGLVNKNITLAPDEIYVAQPIDYHVKELTWTDKAKKTAGDFFRNTFKSNQSWNIARVKIIWNQYARGAAYNDQSSLASAFSSLSITTDTIFINEPINVSDCNLLLVPFACVDSLKKSDIEAIDQFVRNGGCLITDRKNSLAEKFGIKFLSSEMQVHGIRERYFPQEYVSWQFGELAYKFEYSEDDEILCEDASTGFPMAIGHSVGDGKVLFLNAAFDDHSKLGYSHYPFLMDYMRNYFKLMPMACRENLEFYFEPGYRQNSSVEALVKQWVKEGIRIVHVAGWHQYPKYTYDYARLIKFAHANGILVYAWLEPPQVSQKFWNDHPEWREKNYKGEDVRPSWRYPVALTDENCFKAVLAEYKKFLGAYDWDGVNLAEVYFESNAGLINPAQFTPFHPSARKEMRDLYHVNIDNFFNPTSVDYWKNNHYLRTSFIQYRINKLKTINERLLQEFGEIANKKPGFRIIVTTMDSYGSPELTENYGINAADIIELQKKYGFLLQIEDPANRWSTSPDRYAEIGNMYAEKLGGKNNLLLDLNILSFRNKNEITPFPTLLQTGIESYQMIHSAAIGASRTTSYSEASVNPQDLTFFAYANAANVNYTLNGNQLSVNSPTSFMIRLPQENKVISIDGQLMVGCRSNTFLIPAGRHIIDIKHEELINFGTVELQPQILSFTGNILDVKYGMRSLSFAYESDERALVSLNRKLSSVKVDGVVYAFEMMKGNDCYSIFLPAGKHEVTLQTGDKFVYGIDLTSLWSSNFISLFGSLAVALLVVLYVALKIIRKKSK